MISGCLGLEIMELGAEGSMFSFQDQYQGGANGVFICKQMQCLKGLIVPCFSLMQLCGTTGACQGIQNKLDF